MSLHLLHNQSKDRSQYLAADPRELLHLASGLNGNNHLLGFYCVNVATNMKESSIIRLDAETCRCTEKI